MRPAIALALIVTTLAFSGCAAIPLASVGVSMFSAGASAAFREGAAYTKGGVVYRTFSLPLDDLRLVLSDTLARMEMAVISDEIVDGERRILARARDRELQLRLEPVTRTVTQMRLTVSDGLFSKDNATASEIVEQTGRAVEARAAVADARAAAADARAAASARAPRRK